MLLLAGMAWQRRYILACLTGNTIMRFSSLLHVLHIMNATQKKEYCIHHRDSSLSIRLVDKINSSIGQDASSKCLIGVLDIYGFESFKANR